MPECKIEPNQLVIVQWCNMVIPLARANVTIEDGKASAARKFLMSTLVNQGKVQTSPHKQEVHCRSMFIESWLNSISLINAKV
ncbi:hypothetical protein BLOT_012690 [Blomia tropicalis]|nr:hypothetical protein BLOT_012690 [Blomia tropicalis]